MSHLPTFTLPRKLLYASIASIFCFFFTPLIPFNGTGVHAAIVINELLPKTSPASGEWVELYNTDSVELSLNQWKLQNNAGTTFIIGASPTIPAHGWVVFYGSQTNIAFNIDGDTVKLLDTNGTTMDSQSFPGTLGYNTSMGRSQDGGGVWTYCVGQQAPDQSTPGQTNGTYCPPPPATPTPLPTPIPTNSPIPTSVPTKAPVAAAPNATPTPIPAAGSTAVQTVNVDAIPELSLNQVLGASVAPTPTPEPDVFQLKLPKMFAIQAAIVLGIWALLAAAAFIQKKFKIVKRKPPSEKKPTQ